jgi:hypothetical protein
VIDPTEADVRERISRHADRLFREIGYQMRFAGGQCEAHRQSVGIDDGMNLIRQPTARPAHQLSSIACDTSSVLMHPDNGRIDHLRRCVMFGSQRVHDPVPDASLSPANEAIVAESPFADRAMAGLVARPKRYR